MSLNRAPVGFAPICSSAAALFYIESISTGYL